MELIIKIFIACGELESSVHFLLWEDLKNFLMNVSLKKGEF